MKILLSSHFFYPSVGGIETSSWLYAREFVKLGHEVKVLTQTVGTSSTEEFGFEILRAPSKNELLSAHKWSDVVIHNNISLQVAWPLLLVHRPWCIIHQTWLSDGSTRAVLLEPLKRYASLFASNKTLSNSMKTALRMDADVIGNPYDDAVFKDYKSEGRKGLVFIGRLVSDKGVDVAIQAFGKISNLIPDSNFDIIGDGEERPVLENLVSTLKLNGRVRFLGKKTGEDLARQLSHYEVAIIPSRWNEPFGIVALESLACGCAVIASRGGGLPEAVGKCGILFDNGNVDQLAKAILELCRDKKKLEKLREEIPSHLEKFKPSSMASNLLLSFEQTWGIS